MMTGLFSGLGGLAKGVSSMGGFDGTSSAASSPASSASSFSTPLFDDLSGVTSARAVNPDFYRSRRRSTGLSLLDLLE
jgi:hypothetical protein